MTTMSARDFNRDASAAKRAATDNPVVITDRGEPTHVLLSYRHYLQLMDRRSMVERLRMAEDLGEIDFEPARLSDLARGAEL